MLGGFVGGGKTGTAGDQYMAKILPGAALCCSKMVVVVVVTAEIPMHAWVVVEGVGGGWGCYS